MNWMIERAFIMVLLLSVNGFVFCAAYLPFERLAYRRVSARTMVLVNTAALSAFVLPLYFMASLWDGSEVLFGSYDLMVYPDAGGYDGLVGSIRTYIPPEYCGAVWLLGVFAFLLYDAWRYCGMMRILRRETFRICDDVWRVQFETLKTEKGLQNVELVGSCTISTPCVMGLRRRYIVIPSYLINAFDAEEIGFILAHECYHLLHRDLPRKLLVLFLNCLNWFNPLYYFLRRSLSAWMEAACDEAVTERYDQGQRRKYCGLILKVAEWEVHRNRGELFCVSFEGRGVKSYQKRILRIMKKSEKPPLGRVTVLAGVLAMLFCSNAVAKEADVPVNALFSSNVVFANSSDFITMDAETWQAEQVQRRKWFAQSETIAEAIGPTERNAATPVTVKMHEKKSDGSCETQYYRGFRFTLGGRVWKGALIETVTKTKCNH